MSAGSIGQQIINGTYGLDNRPPTAFEALKAWCETYLEPYDYEISENKITLKDFEIEEKGFHACTNFYFRQNGTIL